MNISNMLFGLTKEKLGNIINNGNVESTTSVCLKYALKLESVESLDKQGTDSSEFELKVLMVDQLIFTIFEDNTEGWSCDSFTDEEFVSISNKEELQIHNPDIVHFRHELEIKLIPNSKNGKLVFTFEYQELAFEQLMPVFMDSNIYWKSVKD